MSGYNLGTGYNTGFWYNGDGATIAAIDTHDGARKRKPAQIIYEPAKKRAEELQEWFAEEEILAVELETAPAKPAVWDSAEIEAHAAKTGQSIEQIERKLKALAAYEAELDAEEDEFLMLVAMASIH